MALLNAISLQIFQNKMKISPPVLLTSLAEHLQVLKRTCFIFNNKRISDNNTYNKGGIGRCEMDCVKDHLTERSRYYESDKNSRFCEALYRFNIDIRLIFLLTIINSTYFKNTTVSLTKWII